MALVSSFRTLWQLNEKKYAAEPLNPLGSHNCLELFFILSWRAGFRQDLCQLYDTLMANSLCLMAWKCASRCVHFSMDIWPSTISRGIVNIGTGKTGHTQGRKERMEQSTRITMWGNGLWESQGNRTFSPHEIPDVSILGPGSHLWLRHLTHYFQIRAHLIDGQSTQIYWGCTGLMEKQ